MHHKMIKRDTVRNRYSEMGQGEKEKKQCDFKGEERSVRFADVDFVILLKRVSGLGSIGARFSKGWRCMTQVLFTPRAEMTGDDRE